MRTTIGLAMVFLNRLILGTAQFGMRYSLAENMPSKEDVNRILDYAFDLGIRQLDTAPSYGESETRIGEWLHSRKKTNDFWLCTKMDKMPSMNSGKQVAQQVCDGITASRKRLCCDRLQGYLAHHSQDILNPYIQDSFLGAQNQGWIGDFGASCYAPEEVVKIQKTYSPANLFQIPASILDKRFENIATRSKLTTTHSQAPKFILRSVMLRGLLTLDHNYLPDNISYLRKPILLLKDLASAQNLSTAAFCMLYVLSRHENASITFGVLKFDQLNTIREITSVQPMNLNILAEIDKNIAAIDARLVDLRTIS